MRRVYLSFLGINDYSHCSYTYKNERVENVRFVQEATLKLFSRTWQKTDQVYILTTEAACQNNWRDNGQARRLREKGMCEGLAQRIANLQLQAAVENIMIPAGGSEEEIWQIFKIVYDLLEPQDAVVFDITHAFRSIPMLAVVVLNYARVLKRIRIAGIYYGAFEVLGANVRAMPVAARLAPIFDLTAFETLLHWSEAIDGFIKSGNATLLKEMADQELRPLMREQKDLRDTGKSLKNMVRALDDFALALATCRGTEITGIAARLRPALEQCMHIDLIPAFKPLLQQLQPRIECFGDNEIANGIQAARWCLEHHLIQQGYTILLETLVSHTLKLAGQNPMDMKLRPIVQSTAKIVRTQLPEAQWKGPAAEHIQLTYQIMAIVQNRPMLKLIDVLLQERNDLNHAGYNASPRKPSIFFNKLQEHILTFEEIIN